MILLLDLSYLEIHQELKKKSQKGDKSQARDTSMLQHMF